MYNIVHVYNIFEEKEKVLKFLWIIILGRRCDIPLNNEKKSFSTFFYIRPFSEINLLAVVYMQRPRCNRPAKLPRGESAVSRQWNKCMNISKISGRHADAWCSAGLNYCVRAHASYIHIYTTTHTRPPVAGEAIQNISCSQFWKLSIF